MVLHTSLTVADAVDTSGEGWSEAEFDAHITNEQKEGKNERD